MLSLSFLPGIFLHSQHILLFISAALYGLLPAASSYCAVIQGLLRPFRFLSARTDKAKGLALDSQAISLYLLYLFPLPLKKKESPCVFCGKAPAETLRACF